MCRALGAGMLIVHPPYLWERSYARWLVHEASSFMTEARVAVAVETMYPLWLAGRKLGAYQWLEPGELARAAPCIAMDTSHVTVGRLDVLSTYAVLADKVVHIHLSNNAGDGRDGHLELDSGVVPVNRFLDELAGTGYTGSLALELSVRRYLERPRELVEALRRNRQYVEDRLARATRQPKELGRQ
jgi:sugar phosphate isomerase/epimerase